MDEKRSKKIEDALYKKAVGYTATETVEEYSESDGEIKLVKKKITKKDVPPDVTAAKILLGENAETEFSALDDEKLEAEKTRLLKILKEMNDK